MRFIFSCLIALLWLHRPNLEAGQFNFKELKDFLQNFAIEMGELDHEKDGDGRIYGSPIMPELTFPSKRPERPSSERPSIRPKPPIPFNKPGDRPGKWISLEPAEHMKVETGESILIPFKVSGFEKVSGMQFSIAWNPKVLELRTQEEQPMISEVPSYSGDPEGMPFLVPGDFQLIRPGVLTLVWHDSQLQEGGVTLEDGATLFSLHFQIAGQAGARSLVSLVDKPTPILFVTLEGEAVDVVSRPSVVAVKRALQVAGTVQRLDCEDCPIEGASVILKQNDKEYVQYTDANGKYAFDVDPGFPIELEAIMEWEEGAVEAVDVSDIVSMRKHILGRERLRHAHQLVASDVNGDQSVDVLDIFAMRKVILGKTSRFTEKLDEKSRSPWRFVSEAFKLEASEINALGRLSEEKGLQMAAPQTNVIEADFYGVKLGDANGDWSPEKIKAPRPSRR